MARAKAEAGWNRMLQRNLPQAPVLAADTTALGGRILGKPQTAPRRPRCWPFPGERHEVLTGVALKHDDQSSSRFRSGSAAEEAVAGGDRAVRRERRRRRQGGRLRDPGRAARFIVELRGSYSGVMGLPLYETSLLLDKLRGRNS